MRAGQYVELGSRARSCRAPSIMVRDAPGCRRRQHSDPLRGLPRAKSCSSTGALRRCASPPPTSSARRCSNLLELRGYGFDDVDRLDRLLDRAPARARVDRRWPPATWATTCSPSGPGTKTGMAIRYDNPREIGADRLVNAVAIERALRRARRVRRLRHRDHLRRRSPREGDYVGGSLMTGIEISLEALSERGARLPKIDLAPPRERDRQEHDRRDPLRRRLRLRRARSTRSSAASTTSWASGRTSSPPAASPGSSCPTPRRSTRSTTCSR